MRPRRLRHRARLGARPPPAAPVRPREVDAAERQRERGADRDPDDRVREPEEQRSPGVLPSGPVLGAENVETLKGAWQAATVYPIAPTPIDTGRFVERLTKATLEAGREDGPGSHPRVDHENQLIALLPDLRSRNRVAQVSPSRVDIISTPGAGGDPGTEFTP